LEEVVHDTNILQNICISFSEKIYIQDNFVGGKECCKGDKTYKILVIVTANAVVEPNAMMIKFKSAAIADFAVFAILVYFGLTDNAENLLSDSLIPTH
jgi:hypothetical protein